MENFSAIDTLTAIRAALKDRVDPSYIEGASRTIGGKILGVRVPDIKAVAAEFMKSEGKDLALDELTELADECFKSGGREEQVFAVSLLAKRKKKYDVAIWRMIDEWVETITNWETCDQLATQFAGHIVLDNIYLVTDLTGWTSSENVWRRRFAAAATVTLNHGGHSHPSATFSVLKPLLGDDEDMVRKAVAWALRECAKAAEDATFEFMMENKERTTPFIMKYGSEKFPADKREELGVT